jgi:cytochrome c-type biogenesis protein CcmF
MLYQGEHLLIGQIGHFFAILSFVASLVATFAYFKATQATILTEHDSWRRMARIAFLVETLSVIGIFVGMYGIIYNHYFEYNYAYQHSKRNMETQYLLSSCWGGQEGSFMLWNFWHCILGLVLMRTSKKWEAPVMTVISLAQVFIASFLIGIYFFNTKVGSSPFSLLRDDSLGAPIFQDPQYLQKYITDGSGLNVLLQNYWMVIHPPILFLGFSSTIVPFAFAVAGLWKKQYGEWTKTALPWALFSAGILGLGVMMGAAWAYESLTFGGYWAWDPVENASFVPWLVMVAGIHTMLIFRSTGYSLKASFWFCSLSFLLILYSTFLTRTGVLGDTSVHSFTGEGNSLYWHLIVMMGVFLLISAGLYFRNRKNIPVIHKEESVSSREFWMFVGALVLFISAIYISVFTSLPLINKIFGTNKAIGEDPEYVYNRVMVLIAVVIGLLTAVTQYLKYKNTDRSYWMKRIAWPTGIALVISIMISLFGGIHYDKYGAGYLAAIHLALFSAIYSVVANAAYIWIGLKGKLKSAGASIAHFGFGMMLAGILISSSKKEVISINRTGIVIPGLKDPKGNDDSGLQNMTLIMGVPVPMGKYMVTYLGDSTAPGDEKLYFKINYVHKDSATGRVLEEFNLFPDAFLMKTGGGQTSLSANPSSKHYWHKDIFTFITSMPDPERAKDTSSFVKHLIHEGDTVFYSNGFLVLDKIITANKNNNKDLPLVDSAWLAAMTIYAKNGMQFKAEPALFVKDNLPIYKTDTVMAQSLIMQVNKVMGDEIELGLKESNAVMKYVTLKAFQFPFINILWLGTIIMVTGFMMSARRRFLLNRN